MLQDYQPYCTYLQIKIRIRSTLKQVNQAISIVHWHLLEAKQILEPSIKSPDINNATKLLNWIKSHELKETSPINLQQYSPVREKSKQDKVISLLIEHQHAKKQQPIIKPCFILIHMDNKI